MTLKGHVNGVWSVAFNPDGRQLVSASHDATIRFWDVANGKEAMILKGHVSWIESVAFSPDGKRLASASFDQTIQIRDVPSGPEAMTMKNIAAVTFRRDGQCLAALVDSRHDQTTRCGHWNGNYDVAWTDICISSHV